MYRVINFVTAKQILHFLHLLCFSCTLADDTLTFHVCRRFSANSRCLSQFHAYKHTRYDGVVLVEAPDDTTTTAFVLAALSPGHLKAVKTTKLFTVEETMEAMRKAGGLAFQGPSQG
jgi:hypothetical protein